MIDHPRRPHESFYRVLAEAAEDQIFVINRDDRVEYVNPAAARQFCAAPEQLIGRPRTELFPPDVAERQGRGLAQVFATGTPLYVEGRTMYGDRLVWLSTWLTPVRNGSGEVDAVVGVSRDLTEHKRLEDELRAAAQRRQVVLAHVPLIVWAADRDGIVTFCAGLGLETLRLTADAVVGRRFDDIDVPPSPALGDSLGRALAGESVNMTMTAEDRTYETWSVPLRDAQGEITGATGCMVDITERLRLEEELSNAQKLEAIGRLAGGIAHDFNNNLTAILGYIEMIAEQTGEASPIARDLSEVRRAAERSSDLVRRLLAFGRRQVLRPRHLDLNVIVSGLEPMLGRLLGERIRIDVKAAPGLPAISADAGELEQVIMNLALNARDAMPDGGTLTIETTEGTVPAGLPAAADGRYVLMRIRDTGTGMTPQVRAHVFEPFFTTKPPGQGTGLGLSAVYGIVTQLDGIISIASEVGRGTTVDVHLPATLDPAVPEPPAPAPAAEPPEQRVTILLVEDEDTVRRFARLALERHGFRVLEAATPQEALRWASGDDSIALLLTDVVMPRMNGPELAVHVRGLRPGVRVLYMSGYPSSLVLPEGSIDPSVNLLSKPFTIAQLVAAARAVLAAPA